MGTPPHRSSPHPIGTPVRGLVASTGALASAAWLATQEMFPREPKWFVEATLAPGETPPSESFDERLATRFLVEIYAEEWGFMFVHGGLVSWIRVTDVPFIHGRDDHRLLRQTPPLSRLGALVQALEAKHAIRFNRERPTIRTTIAGAEASIASWVRAL